MQTCVHCFISVIVKGWIPSCGLLIWFTHSFEGEGGRVTEKEGERLYGLVLKVIDSGSVDGESGFDRFMFHHLKLVEKIFFAWYSTEVHARNSKLGTCHTPPRNRWIFGCRHHGWKARATAPGSTWPSFRKLSGAGPRVSQSSVWGSSPDTPLAGGCQEWGPMCFSN